MKIPARFDSIKEIKKIFPKEIQVVGVGVSAFQRSGLGYILPNYQILSLLETNDLPAIRRVCPVTVIKGEEKPQKLNTSSILKLNWVREWLKQKNNLNLFVYKAATPLDEIIKTLPVKLLSSPGYIRKPLEDKKVFRVEAPKAGIRIPRGESLAIKELTEGKWDKLKQKYGERLVFQLTDYSTGGGQGTFFIDTKADFDKFHEFVKSEDRKKALSWVNVCERVKGRSASITGCATRHGVVTGILQTQIMDQPELAGFKGRSGVWLGHDWNVRFSDKAQLNAERLCQKWGEYIYQKGYKGIYGLDVMVTDKDEIIAVECNSRYTGAFPVYTMMQIAQGEMPLDVWHLAEWMNLDYEMDIKEAQKVSREVKTGAHIILHNLEEKEVKVEKQVRAGVYKFSRQPYFQQPIVSDAGASELSTYSAQFPRRNVGGQANCASVSLLKTDRLRKLSMSVPTFIRPGFSLMDIKNDNELVLCDRIPNQGQTVKPGERIGKLCFKRRIIDERGRLLPEICRLVRSAYAGFGFTPKS